MSNLEAKERLIIALDVPTRARALHLVDTLAQQVGMFKIGSQLFTACGPQLVRDVIDRGGRVFLDLKFHDIPNTVASAVVEAARLGVSICNVHALGGLEMMKSLLYRLNEVVEREGLKKPKVLAVTVLTSHDQKSLQRLGIDEPIAQLVVRLARLTAEAGLDGVVASAHEIEPIRSALPGSFIILTPGLRPEWATAGDQKRVMTPREALEAGADYLVIGRPVIEHPDPQEAVRLIKASLS